MTASRYRRDDHAITTSGLTRYFGSRGAVLDLDLSVPRGSVFSLLGRNGSGKTTSIRMLLGLLAPTRGTARVLGEDSSRLSPATRGRVGYLAEGHFLHGWMRVRECAWFQSQSFPRWNMETFRTVIDYFEIDAEARARTLSRGQRAGVCLALTLATDPELLILDDPALGLDPAARRGLVEALIDVAGRGDRTILLSSHLLDDVERVADHVAILEAGRLRVHCAVDVFRERVSRWVLTYGTPPAAVPDVPGLVNCRLIGNELHVTVANPDERTEYHLRESQPQNIRKVSLSLEDAVVDYLQRRSRPGSFLQPVGGVS